MCQWTAEHQYTGGRNHVLSATGSITPGGLTHYYLYNPVYFSLTLPYSLVSTAPLLNFSRWRIQSRCLVTMPAIQHCNWDYSSLWAMSLVRIKKIKDDLSHSLSHHTMLSTWKSQVQVTDTWYKIKCMFPKQGTIIYTAEVLWVFSPRFSRFTF